MKFSANKYITYYKLILIESIAKAEHRTVDEEKWFNLFT